MGAAFPSPVYYPPCWRTLFGTGRHSAGLTETVPQYPSCLPGKGGPRKSHQALAGSEGRWGRPSPVLYTIPQAGGPCLAQAATLPASLGRFPSTPSAYRARGGPEITEGPGRELGPVGGGFPSAVSRSPMWGTLFDTGRPSAGPTGMHPQCPFCCPVKGGPRRSQEAQPPR